MTKPEKHTVVGAVLRAIPFREAVSLHSKLKSGAHVTPEMRETIRNGVRNAARAYNTH